MGKKKAKKNSPPEVASFREISDMSKALGREPNAAKRCPARSRHVHPNPACLCNPLALAADGSHLRVSKALNTA